MRWFEDAREQLGRHRIAGPEVPTPERDPVRAREAYPFRLDVRTRFGDLDTNRHVNNVRLATWCVGLAEAVGSCHATAADGEPVDLAAALEPFRLRG